MKTVLRVEGMHCGACALSIDDRLEELDGVQKSKTSYVRGRTKLAYDETVIELDRIEAAITELGYQSRSD